MPELPEGPLEPDVPELPDDPSPPAAPARFICQYVRVDVPVTLLTFTISNPVFLSYETTVPLNLSDGELAISKICAVVYANPLFVFKDCVDPMVDRFIVVEDVPVYDIV